MFTSKTYFAWYSLCINFKIKAKLVNIWHLYTYKTLNSHIKVARLFHETVAYNINTQRY